MIRTLVLVMLTTLVAANLHADDKATPQPPKYLVSVSLQEKVIGPPAAKITTKTVCEPTLLVQEGQEGKLQIGETLGSMQALVGTQLTVRVDRADMGKVKVDGVLELSTGKEVDTGIVVRKATCIHVKKIIPLDSPVRALVEKSDDKELWLELTVSAHSTKNGPAR